MLHPLFQKILKPQIQATCEHIWLIHTNGAWECQACHKLIVPRNKLQAYQGPAYTEITEGEDDTE